MRRNACRPIKNKNRISIHPRGADKSGRPRPVPIINSSRRAQGACARVHPAPPCSNATPPCHPAGLLSMQGVLRSVAAPSWWLAYSLEVRIMNKVTDHRGRVTLNPCDPQKKGLCHYSLQILCPGACLSRILACPSRPALSAELTVSFLLVSHAILWRGTNASSVR